MSLMNLLASGEAMIPVQIWLNPRTLFSAPRPPLMKMINPPKPRACGFITFCQRHQMMGPRLTARTGLVDTVLSNAGHISLPVAPSLCRRFILWVDVLCHFFNILLCWGKKLITNSLPGRPKVFQRSSHVTILYEQLALVYYNNFW